MNKIIELDTLKIELIETQKLLYEILFRLDKVKMALQKDKVSKKEILEIIDGE